MSKILTFCFYNLFFLLCIYFLSFITVVYELIFYFIFRFILNVPKLRRNLLELRTFLLNELCMLFPKINAYYQVPQTIKCQLDITEYGSSK